MSIADDGVDFKSAPQDYADLYRQYWGYVVALVRKYGIDDSNKEDVASEILSRFLQRGFLDKFDPSLEFSYDGAKHPANFKTFLSGFVVRYVRGFRDKEKRYADREMLIMDKPTFYNDVPSTWAEWFGIEAVESHEDDILEQVVEENLVKEVRAYLATVPRRSSYDQCDLVELFDAVMVQIHDQDGVVLRELKEKFGLSGTGMNGWFWWLRSNISAYLGVPLPPKRIRR